LQAPRTTLKRRQDPTRGPRKLNLAKSPNCDTFNQDKAEIFQNNAVGKVSAIGRSSRALALIPAMELMSCAGTRAAIIDIVPEGNKMDQTIESKNKKLVLEAFDILFNKRDYVAAEKFWSPNYIQHSAHIPPGRERLFNLVKSIPPTARYESREIVAENDLVIVQGRYSGLGLPANWIVVDIVRMKDGVLAEHWDVIQDEATHETPKAAFPCLVRNFPNRRSSVLTQRSQDNELSAISDCRNTKFALEGERVSGDQ
jgi:predicted SnoaL-like aldol condensation-catalyzing enzyme